MTGSTRRGFLSAVGALGLASLGAVSGRSSATGAPANESPRTDAAVDPPELESFVDEAMAERVGDVTPGATVAVVDGADVVLAKGYGTADAEAGTPVSADQTAFRIGSVSKLVTWTAVMQGVERGVLALDADVESYLGDSAVAIPDTDDAPVTLRHLGTHTAGFASVLDPGVVDDPDALTSLETALVERRPARVRPPGAAVGYSNYGTMLAGHVVAQAHDTTFQEYVQSEIYGPLGMDDSTFAQPVPDDHPGDLAAPHSRDGNSFAVADPVYVNWRPAGSMTTTATDMATFMSAHLGDGSVGDRELLAPETAATMHSQQYERHPAVNNWRYGFHEYGAPDAGLIGHSGGTIYFESQLVLAPDDGVGIFVAYNARSGDESPAAVVDEILDGFDLGADPPAPTPTSESSATTEPGATTERGGQARAERVAGEYSATNMPTSGPGQVVDLLGRITVDSADDGRLVTDSMARGRREWVEARPYVYHQVDGGDVLAFDVADGDVHAMHLNSVPQAAYQPVPFHERRLVAGGTVGVALAGFLLSLAGRGGLGVWRHLSRRLAAADTGAADESDVGGSAITDDGMASRSSDRGRLASLASGVERRGSRPAWLARAAGTALCAAAVAFVVGFLAVLQSAGELSLITKPLPMQVALALPYLVAPLAAATVVGAIAGWWRGYWSLAGRVHQTVLALLAVGFVWQLAALGFLPF